MPTEHGKNPCHQTAVVSSIQNASPEATMIVRLSGIQLTVRVIGRSSFPRRIAGQCDITCASRLFVVDAFEGHINSPDVLKRMFSFEDVSGNWECAELLCSQRVVKVSCKGFDSTFDIERIELDAISDSDAFSVARLGQRSHSQAEAHLVSHPAVLIGIRQRPDPSKNLLSVFASLQTLLTIRNEINAHGECPVAVNDVDFR